MSTPLELKYGMEVAGRFRIMHSIGEGTYGDVYLCADEQAGGLLRALKLLKLWSAPRKVQRAMVDRFRLEFETGRIQSRHLVQSLYYDQLEGNPFLVMEYCEGGNLRTKVVNQPPHTQVAGLLRQILLGLRDLHKEGKTHRDLKPENCLLSDSSDQPGLKLTDFGISGHVNSLITVLRPDGKPAEVLGSYTYMAPEQLHPLQRLETLLPTIDIFAFGVIGYELFTGCLPFGSWGHESDIGPYLQRMRAGKLVASLSGQRPAVDRRWVEIIERCLLPDRNKRFQQVGEILRLLGFTNEEIPATSSTKLGLQVMAGEDYKRVYPLPVSNGQLPVLVRLGREDDSHVNDISIREHSSRYISRAHATLEYHAQQAQWVLRDGQWIQQGLYASWRYSQNGTFVNGMSVGNYGQQLRPGDIITIGNTTLKVLQL
jgi:serine/threonine protein kinase